MNYLYVKDIIECNVIVVGSPPILDNPEVRDLNSDFNRKYLDEYNRMEIRP